MIQKNRFEIILSSVIVLLPILFGIIMWNELPDMITTHWGADGIADGFSGKAFAVFGLPMILLVLHFICLLATLLDKKQKEQNTKALRMIFWIVPMISILANGCVYRAAFGKPLHLSLFMPALIGVMFIFMGNYLPKVRQNRTLGIKIPWTLNNEENWNKTHRMAGKVWVVGGLVLWITALMPLKVMIWTAVCVILAVTGIPLGYSYFIYRQHRKEGVVYTKAHRSAAERIVLRITAVILSLVFIGAAILMFTGNIEVLCEDTAVTISAPYWSDLEIDYSEIEMMDYRSDLDIGVRTYGFGSPRLSIGNFENNEFGAYTLYAYTGAKAYIVLTGGEQTLVIGLSDAAETQTLYETLLEKTGE